MARISGYEQLDEAVQAIVTGLGDATAGSPHAGGDARTVPLLRVAAALRDLPRESFKARLKSDLRRSASMATLAEPVPAIRAAAAAYLTVKNAARAIEFYKRAFGAIEKGRLSTPSGEIGHAEIEIGGSTIMLSDEFPEYGGISPETLGGSPMKMHLYVDDVDAFSERAVAEGAKITRPIADQFYGDRSGHLADPFGYTWIVATHKEVVSLEEIQKRFSAMAPPPERKRTGVSPVPEGYRTLATYLVARDADGLIDFVTKTFGAEEKFRSVGSAGGRHAELRIGDSMLMIGGGIPGGSWKGEPLPSAFHVYVPDCDAVYRRALAAGATSITQPRDQEYGERSGSVKDPAGNFWYIATYKGENYKWAGAPDVQPYLHPLRVEPVVHFLKRAFGAQEMGRYSTPDGVVHHTTIKIGDSFMEMGEAQGIYQPMPTMFYLYVPNCDELYQRALAAGATAMSAPADQPYGDRSGAVKDVFGNQWYIATHIKDVENSPS
jgi:PhnB protein